MHLLILLSDEFYSNRNYLRNDRFDKVIVWELHPAAFY